MRMKTCIICHRQKELIEFYKHPGMADGRLGACKQCVRERARRAHLLNMTDPGWAKRERARGREKFHRLNYAEKYRIKTKEQRKRLYELTKESRRKFPEKFKARARLKRAVRLGKIKKCPCRVCGTLEKVEGHHFDYSKPLDVVWLCTKHHKELHRKDKE